MFSEGSFSLETPPLDMSAAMEKALAREESCGLGDAVYSMLSPGGPSQAGRLRGSLPAFPQIRGEQRKGDKRKFLDKRRAEAKRSQQKSPST